MAKKQFCKFSPNYQMMADDKPQSFKENHIHRNGAIKLTPANMEILTQLVILRTLWTVGCMDPVETLSKVAPPKMVVKHKTP